MLSVEKTALIIIDVQGALAQVMSGREELFDSLRKLIKGVRILGLPIVWAEQVPAKLGKTIPQLAELLDGVTPVAKNTFSCCADKNFMAKIKELGRRQLLVAGIETHVCVTQTVIELLGMGYETHVVSDATSSRTRENRGIGLERMKDCGAVMTSVEMALFELLKKAEGSEFKRIMKIIK